MITLIRHAHCDDGSAGLSSLGKQQAAALEGHYDVVMVSPLLRAQQTFLRSNITGDLYITEPLVREQVTEDVDLLPGEAFHIESEERVDERVQTLKALLQQYVGRTICIISHADFIWHFTSHWAQGIQFGQWLSHGECIHC